ncbi:hypothetical protein E0W80_10415 [Microbacterium sp. PI-1]|uniref:hypothetical protein n=1 Tax=Microbacterium sp. PI-1 TaxID=2545631 RepID=UPI00103B4E7B|nr:hypothetical protein [Microbacterium sp. PI-1]TCJ23546.1 hypothetical protein E0W80_10415 [Microbacterium sp. PI-1]
MTSMRNPNLTFIVNAIKAAGGKTPKAITEAVDAQARILEEARKARGTVQGYEALALAWANAVLEGRDPADDRDVFRAMLSNSLADGDIEYAATNAVTARAIEGITNSQDEILALLKKAFDEAGRTLTNAHSILGAISLDNTTAIFQLGPVAVQAYQDAQEARRITRLIDNGWTGMNNITQFAGSCEHVTRWADTGITTWERMRRSKDTWDMTVAGATLNLAIDRATIHQRTARIANEREERDTAPERTERAKRINYLTGTALS